MVGRAAVVLLQCLGGIRLSGLGGLAGRRVHRPPTFPRVGRPFHPIPHPRQRLGGRRIILIRMREVSFLWRCPGSPPAPRGATHLPGGGGTSSGVPRGPPRRSPQNKGGGPPLSTLPIDVRVFSNGRLLSVREFSNAWGHVREISSRSFMVLQSFRLML